MSRFRMGVIVLLGVLLAGCSSLLARFEKLPVAESSAWKRVTAGADAPGLYFRDLSTGATEGWQLVAGAADLPVRFLGDQLVLVDGRYLINRAPAKVFEWASTDVALVAASPDRLLFRKGERLFILDGAGKRLSVVKLPDAAAGEVLGAIAPDGKMAALLVQSTGAVYSVDLFKWQVAKLAEPTPADYGPLRYLLGGKELVLGHAGGLVRYSWEGKPLGEIAAPGTECVWNRAGTRVACAANGAPPHVVVADVETGHAIYRVMGATAAYWAADGSTVVIARAPGGPYSAVTSDGRLLPAAGIPSPVAQDVYARDGAVLDATGKATTQILIDLQKWAFGSVPPWGSSGAELRYRVTARPSAVPPQQQAAWSFEPSVQMAPFPAETWLQVVAAPGDCLNLRAAAGKEGAVIRCLAGGTRFQAKPSAGPAVEKDGERWLSVTTEKGEAGWVAISTGNVGYASK